VAIAIDELEDSHMEEGKEEEGRDRGGKEGLGIAARGER
jgi:hypothetical protein